MKLIQMTTEFEIGERALMEKMIMDWLLMGTQCYVRKIKRANSVIRFYVYRPVDHIYDIVNKNYCTPGGEYTNQNSPKINAETLGIIEDIDIADLYKCGIGLEGLIYLTP